MWETGSYKTHDDHKNLYEALEKSMNRDHLDQLQADLAEARKKHQKRLDSPRTPSGSLPPPPPPPASASGALDHSRYGNKGSRLALSISKMKAACYPDFGLKLLVPEQMWIDERSQKTHADSQCCQNQAFSRYVYDYLSEIVLRRTDFQEHKIAEKDLKNIYPSGFKDLNLLLLQGHLDYLSGSDKCMLSTAVKL
nr:hypothetical protein [Tanacetum cinerariifolium]